jgi:excisionase family DNA binding protein
MRYALEMKQRLLSVRQAATYLGVSVRTVRRVIASGQLKTVTVRSLRRVPFLRIYGLKATIVPHQEMRLLSTDLDKIVFEGLPGPRRKAYNKKDARGKFVSKVDWPEVEKEMERKKNLSPIEKLDEPIDFARLDAPLCPRSPNRGSDSNPEQL